MSMSVTDLKRCGKPEGEAAQGRPNVDGRELLPAKLDRE